MGPDPRLKRGRSVGPELLQHSFELALLRCGQFGQDAGISDMDRAFGVAGSARPEDTDAGRATAPMSSSLRKTVFMA